jgi:DNA-binding transcriptional LysR family regulator
LLIGVTPRLDGIRVELTALSGLRDKPAGTVRITCSEHAADTVLWLKLAPVLRNYPEVKLELYIDHSFADIAAERFDAGVRLGESLEKDMVAAGIGPNGRLVVVAAPSYFDRFPVPETPQDLMKYSCINLRLSTQGGLYAWESEKGNRPENVCVDRQLIFNAMRPVVAAALERFGVAFLPENSVGDKIRSGKLVQVLDERCPKFSGCHLYYQAAVSIRQHSGF